MQLLLTVRRALIDLWQGPPNLPRSLQLEWRFVAVRWIGVVSVAAGLPLAHLSTERLIAAYAVMIVGALYNLAVQRLLPRYPAIFARGYVTAIGDSLLSIAMIWVGGGFDSPFYYILFTIMLSVSMRYGYGTALAITVIYSGFDILEHLRA